MNRNLLLAAALAVALAPPAAPVMASENHIAARCSALWPSDFNMQEYCIDQQLEAASHLPKTVEAVEPAALREAFSVCIMQWQDKSHDTFDFVMVEYCYKQQSEALARLGKN